MKTKILLAAVGLCATLGTQAAERAIEFQAIVTEQIGLFGLGVGETFSGRFTYDTEAPQMGSGVIRYVLQSFELDLGSVGKATISEPRYALMGDGVWLDGRGVQLEDVGYEFGRLHIALGQDTRDFRLPDEPEDLLNWQLPGIGSLTDGMGTSGTLADSSIRFEVTSVSMVPEASGWAMSVLGLGGMAAVARARKRHRVAVTPPAAV